MAEWEIIVRIGVFSTNDFNGFSSTVVDFVSSNSGLLMRRRDPSFMQPEL